MLEGDTRLAEYLVLTKEWWPEIVPHPALHSRGADVIPKALWDQGTGVKSLSLCLYLPAITEMLQNTEP